MTTLPTVLITGCTSGIGYELTLLFAEKGHPLILVARNEERMTSLCDWLRQKYQTKLLPIVADLSDLDAPKSIYESVKSASWQVDILINNAGVGIYGYFYETSLLEERKMSMLNMVALTELTKYFLPGMRERESGKILNVASTAAFQPGPLMSVYFASKAYVLSFSEALREEVRREGITVTTLCPGPTRTGFQEKANMEHSPLFDKKIMSANTVAEEAYKGLMKGKSIIIPGFGNKALVFLLRFVPRTIVPKMVKSLIEQTRKEDHKSQEQEK
jgi:short-subunit dehydrogenase